MDLDPVVFVLLQDLLRVFVRVERVHEDQRHVGIERLVQVLPDEEGGDRVLDSGSTPFPDPKHLPSPADHKLPPHLDLLHRQVQKGVLVADADQALGALAAHARTQTAIELDHG